MLVNFGPHDEVQSEPTTKDCGLFWDVASRPQGDCTDDEIRQGAEALEVMSNLYASVIGTTVLQHKDVPSRPVSYDGALRLFSLPPHLCTEAALRATLADFGTVTSCEIETYTRSSTPSTHATVRFENHADAQSAVFALKYVGDLGVALHYNSTPYEGEGGRGWCVIEKGSTSAVVAHLNAAAQSGKLPKRIAFAQKRRAKLIDITGGRTRVTNVTTDPTRLLQVVLLELSKARFTFDQDRELAERTMAAFVEAIQKAIEATATAKRSVPAQLERAPSNEEL